MNIAPQIPAAVTAEPNTILIDGMRGGARSGRLIPVVDAATGEVFAALSAGCAAEIDAAVTSARAASEGGWATSDPLVRGRLLIRLSELILAHKDELARIEARDVGKPLKQALADIDSCARYFEFYGTAADKLHGETIPYRPGFTVIVTREPWGVTGHIIPWTYPVQIMGRSVGAALAAGNACVVKPAEDASLSIVRIGELALEAGLPPGVFNVVTGYGAEAGAALAAHPGIDHISFTGSPVTGAAVQVAAAKNNTSVTMELGGKSPQIVFADADIEAALPVLQAAIVQNAGQTCSAGSRLLVERPIYDQLVPRLAAAFRALTCGPGLDNPDCGPLVNGKQHARVNAMLADAAAAGVATIAEGQMVPGASPNGFFVTPKLLGPVAVDAPIAQDEIFGPVLVVIPFDGEDEAVRIANGTAYGLAAGVWTADGARQMRMVHKIRAGQVYINNYGAGGGVELPFGGYKKSGFGREKGIEGLKSFTVLKTATFRHG